MKAVWYERNGPAREVLQCGDIPDPVPGIGEVLVRVHASGVNPHDWKTRSGSSKWTLQGCCARPEDHCARWALRGLRFKRCSGLF